MPPMRNAAKPHSRAHRRQTESPRTGRGIELPATGCTLPVPDAPAAEDWTEGMESRWVELWESPQATQWDDTVKGTVAVLVIYESLILAGKASAWHAQEARYASEALGLTPRALAALNWKIVETA